MRFVIHLWGLKTSDVGKGSDDRMCLKSEKHQQSSEGKLTLHPGGNQAPGFYLFIDEFQNFTTDAFAAILAEARKYCPCLTLSHQYIDQLPEPIRQAVFGNVGTFVAFRIGYTDAEMMAKEFGKTFPPTVLADLERYEAVVKLLVKGSNREPFRAQMLPPLEFHVGRRDKLIALSRERFAIKRMKIEAKLKRWME